MKNHFFISAIIGTCLVFLACETPTKSVDRCGDGFLDPGEDCDPDVGAQTCASLGYHNVMGTLRCSDRCRYDLSDCGGKCGDAEVDSGYGEECDGPNLGGQSCQGLGFGGGFLLCTQDCRLDTSECTNACGNSYLEAGEECDDGDRENGDGCSSDCEVEEGWECTGSPSLCVPVCGDGILLPEEVCEQDMLDGQTCEGEGWHPGELLCSGTCQLDFSSCGGRCGDGLIQATWEDCDGLNMGENTCDSLGFFGGTLGCMDDCKFDVSGCNKITQVATGGFHTCMLLSEGVVRCWGLNADGQLGDGTNFSRNTATTVHGLSQVEAISAGNWHTCARLQDGTARCWGRNNVGQLGIGNTNAVSTPHVVTGISGVTDISAGYIHTCAVLSDGTARCWGFGMNYRLGTGNTTNRNTPQAVVGLVVSVDAIAAGFQHTCALSSAGQVYCWGDNGVGQGGSDSSVNTLTSPTAVAALSGVGTLVAGDNHTCATLTDGTARCWGGNLSGQLGDGTTTRSWTPVLVINLSGAVMQVSASLQTPPHTCAYLQGGTAHCWGYNYTGQLGDNTTANKSTPVQVLSIHSASHVSSRGYHSCAVVEQGRKVRCWGANIDGQLGNGTNTNSPVPVDVR